MHVGETACIWCNDNDLDFKSRVTCISKHFFKFQPYVQSVIQSWASSFCSYEIWKVLELRFIKKQYYWHLYSSVLQRILLISFIISIYLFFSLARRLLFFYMPSLLYAAMCFKKYGFHPHPQKGLMILSRKSYEAVQFSRDKFGKCVWQSPGPRMWV